MGPNGPSFKCLEQPYGDTTGTPPRSGPDEPNSILPSESGTSPLEEDAVLDGLRQVRFSVVRPGAKASDGRCSKLSCDVSSGDAFVPSTMGQTIWKTPP